MSDLGISNDAPENGQGADEGNAFDFKQGYEQLRPEYTRTTQDLSEAKQRLSDYESFLEALSDPDTQAEALASLGFEMETGATQKDESEFQDPLEKEVEYLRGVVDELRQGRELEAVSQQEQEVLDLRDDFIGESITAIEEQFEMKFDGKDEEVLGNLAIAMSDTDGVPDVQGAFAALYGEEGLLERQRSQWIDSKVGAFSAPFGTTIPADKIDRSTRAGRVEFVDRRLQALDQMQQ